MVTSAWKEHAQGVCIRDSLFRGPIICLRPRSRWLEATRTDQMACMAGHVERSGDGEIGAGRVDVKKERALNGGRVSLRSASCIPSFDGFVELFKRAIQTCFSGSANRNRQDVNIIRSIRQR